MRHSLLSVAVIAALSGVNVSYAADAEPASPHTFTYNVGLFSQYIFRGLTQTAYKPALQGGMDYSHSSGLYAGTWASNISWLEDAGVMEKSSLEWDIYGGYKGAFGESGFTYDVGLLNYVYPGNKVAPVSGGAVNPYTLEAYGAVSYAWLTAKVSYGLTNIFGVRDSQGSYYAELNANYPIGETGYSVLAHIGRQEYKGDAAPGLDNDSFYSYTDYKLGATKTWANGVVVGGYYTDTTAKDKGYGNNFYKVDNIGNSTFTFFVQKNF